MTEAELGPLNRAVMGNARAAGFEVHKITDREEWLCWRRHDVTASAAAGLLAASPYQTPFALWMEKAGLTTPKPMTKRMRSGLRSEALHIEMLREDFPEWEIEQGAIYIRDPAYRIGATPDAFATRPDRRGIGVVQLKKTTREAYRRGWNIPDEEIEEPPAYHQIQTIMEGDLSRASWAVVSAVILDEDEIFPHEIKMRPLIADVVRQETADFWRRIAERDPYPVDYLADGDLILANAHPIKGVEIDLTGNERVAAILAEHERLKDMEARGRAAHAERRALDAELCRLMGGAAVARHGDSIVTVSRRLIAPQVRGASEAVSVKVKKGKTP
jgi:hypothetical protein